jgi:ribosomal protein L7/L12
MSELTKEAIEALSKGSVIKAIKITRLASGLGLKEAKDQVDIYLQQHPDLKVQNPQMSQETSFRLIVILIAAAAMLWLFFKN